MDANYDTKQGKDSQPNLQVENDYYFQQEMSKLTDGSENNCADGEFEMEDPFSDDEFFSSGDEM